MCKVELDAVKEELEAYINGLYPLEKEEVKVYLRSALSLHMQVVHQDKPGELLGELVTQVYLERLIPDEETALAYLLALRERGTEIGEIEGEKWDVARRLVDPSSERGQLHLALLEQVWGQQDGPAVGDDAALAVRMARRWGEANDTLDTWAEAELTRVRMQSFIKKLEPMEVEEKRNVLRGTMLAGTKVPIRTWIIATALVAQAKKSPTPMMLQHLLSNRATANRSLDTMRQAMISKMESVVRSGSPHLGNYRYVDGLDVGFRLYYRNISDDERMSRRHDLVLRQFGKMLVVNTVVDEIEFAGAEPLPAERDDKNQIMDVFEDWIGPHREAEDPGSLHKYLYEFAYRYNADKKRILGWGLINGLLRLLMNIE